MGKSKICSICTYTGDQTGACADCTYYKNFELDSIHEAAPLMLETLKQVGCQFDMCPGPEEPSQDMLTCFVCAAIKEAKGEN